MKACLSIDVGGTTLKSAVLDSQAHIFTDSFCSVPSNSDGRRDEVLQAFRKVISHGLGIISAKGAIPAGVGISTPGPFDMMKAMSLMQHKFKSIYKLDLRSLLYEISGLSPDVPIVFMHDANAALAGELLKGKAQGYENAALVTLGTGLGFAFSQKGDIQCNEIGGPRVSIFRTPCKNGILEDFTAKRGFLKVYQQQSGAYDVSGIEVADLGMWALNGDAASIKTFQIVGHILAESLGPVLDKYEIECLLFGGQISKSFTLMQDALKTGLRSISGLKKIGAAGNIDSAALIGACAGIWTAERK